MERSDDLEERKRILIPSLNRQNRNPAKTGRISACRKSLAEFALASAKKVGIIFSGGVYVGENTARLANVRRVRRGRALRALQRAAAPFQTRAQ